MVCRFTCRQSREGHAGGRTFNSYVPLFPGTVHARRGGARDVAWHECRREFRCRRSRLARQRARATPNAAERLPLTPPSRIAAFPVGHRRRFRGLHGVLFRRRNRACSSRSRICPPGGRGAEAAPSSFGRGNVTVLMPTLVQEARKRAEQTRRAVFQIQSVARLRMDSGKVYRGCNVETALMV